MSLTTLISATGSPTRAWFRERFPNLERVRKDWRGLGTATIPRRCMPQDGGTIGTPFDYRLRYCFATTRATDFVAARGADILVHALGGFVWHTEPLDAPAYDGEYTRVRRRRDRVMYCIEEHNPYTAFGTALDRCVGDAQPQA